MQVDFGFDEYDGYDDFDELEEELLGAYYEDDDDPEFMGRKRRKKKRIPKLIKRFLKKFKNKIKSFTPRQRKLFMSVVFAPIPPISKRLALATMIKKFVRVNKKRSKGKSVARRRPIRRAVRRRAKVIRRGRPRRVTSVSPARRMTRSVGPRYTSSVSPYTPDVSVAPIAPIAPIAPVAPGFDAETAKKYLPIAAIAGIGIFMFTRKPKRRK